MLSMTRRMDYALVAMSEIARHAPTRRSAREIAERANLPLPMLTNILGHLKTRGLVTASRGVRGGYCLAARAEEISLASLIEAVEGPLKLTLCCGDDGPEELGACSIQDHCKIREPVRKLNDRLKEFLSRVTLAQIACTDVPPDVPVGLTISSRVDALSCGPDG